MSSCAVWQAQKELLDTELDLYKKTQAGEDTAQLKIKYTQLQLEVMSTHTLEVLLKSCWIVLRRLLS